MGLINGTYKNKNSTDIYPRSLMYVFISFIVILMMLLFIALPFWLLIRNEPINFLGFGYINDKYVQFLISMPISIFPTYVFLRTGIMNFKVSFTETHIIVPKIPEIQEKKVELSCNEIVTCEAIMEGYNYYFMLTSLNGKKRKMSIIRFSFRQIEMILKMIQERGGLIDQNINDIINPLRIRKKK
jgi:hypothetical protein